MRPKVRSREAWSQKLACFGKGEWISLGGASTERGEGVAQCHAKQPSLQAEFKQRASATGVF